ncbi:unnamed protein product [Linum trigynum]|uniref:Uncharacterized protein n=1 Tax=Linum trigynum TaxID=586398 RepID=A0AAV2CEV8_9ROSI
MGVGVWKQPQRIINSTKHLETRVMGWQETRAEGDFWEWGSSDDERVLNHAADSIDGRRQRAADSIAKPRQYGRRQLLRRGELSAARITKTPFHKATKSKTVAIS